MAVPRKEKDRILWTEERTAHPLKINCFKLGDSERLLIDPQGTARPARAPFRGVATGDGHA